MSNTICIIYLYVHAYIIYVCLHYMYVCTIYVHCIFGGMISHTQVHEHAPAVTTSPYVSLHRWLQHIRSILMTSDIHIHLILYILYMKPLNVYYYILICVSYCLFICLARDSDPVLPSPAADGRGGAGAMVQPGLELLLRGSVWPCSGLPG